MLSKCVGVSVRRRRVVLGGAVFSIPGPDLRNQSGMSLGTLTRRVGELGRASSLGEHSPPVSWLAEALHGLTVETLVQEKGLYSGASY